MKKEKEEYIFGKKIEILNQENSIKEQQIIRNKTLNCKLTPKQLAQIDFVIENNIWVHNRSQFMEIAILELLNKKITEPESPEETRRYRKGHNANKVIAVRITDETSEQITEFMEEYDFIRSKAQFLELAITELLNEEVKRIESEGIRFQFKEYKNYK